MATVSAFAVVLSVATQRSPKEICHCVVLCQCVVATFPKRKTRTLPRDGYDGDYTRAAKETLPLLFVKRCVTTQKTATMKTIVLSAVYESWRQCLHHPSSFSAPFYGNFKLQVHGSEDT